MLPDSLSHYAIDTRCLHSSPRAAADDNIIAFLKTFLRNGGGTIGIVPMTISLESHQHAPESWIFTVGFEAPAIRCWLSRSPNPALWQFGIPEPPAPWLAVTLLEGARSLDIVKAMMLSAAQFNTAWALLEDWAN